MKSLFKNIVILLISFLDPLVSKKSEYVIYNSYPDLSDNSFALFLYTLEHYPKKRNIWLLKSMSVKQATRNIKVYSDKTNFKFVKRDSLQGAWYYLRSKYVFFTHGLYAGSEISKHHVVVNLWHGMPLKNIGLMDKNTINQKSSHTIASSLFYQQIMSQSLGLTLNQVLVVGQPRIDLLYQGVSSVEKLGICMFNYQKMILWTPTYRQSIVGDLRYDGKITDHLPLMGKNKLSELDLILQ